MKKILILSFLITTILSARMKVKLKANDVNITMNDTSNDTDKDTTPIIDEGDDIIRKLDDNDTDDDMDDDDDTDDDMDDDDDTAYYAFMVQLTNTDNGNKMLVDASGYPLYTYSSDNSTSSCYGPCASRWPPLILNGDFDFEAMPPLNSSDFSLIKRKDGFDQLSFKNAPLYYSIKDRSPNSKPKGHSKKENDGLFSSVTLK